MDINFNRNTTPMFMETSLLDIASSHTLRCDAKQSEQRFKNYKLLLESKNSIELSQFLSKTIIKGSQPKYIEDIDVSGIPVINTLSIQNLKINIVDCRFITEEAFNYLDDSRKLKQGDVLLTVDGGTSIGKPALFDLQGDFTVDSHVAILRPEGINPITLIYLLASPFGQLQFNKAESGASGQTAVTEDDIRRFKFPIKDLETLEKETLMMDSLRQKYEAERLLLDEKINKAWKEFSNNLAK